MAPITLNRSNILHWLLFGLVEAWRVLKALFTGGRDRVTAVARHVETHADEGDPWDVLVEIDTFSYRNRFLMNVGEEKGAILIEQLRQTQATRVLELGAYCGYSAVLMANNLAARGGELISLESSAHNARMAGRIVAHAGLASTVEFRVGKASDLIEDLEGQFDVVFIDHWKDDYLKDLRLLEERGLLRPGARIVADNVGIFSEALEPYLDYVRESGRFESTHHPTRMEYNDAIDDGVEVSIWRPALKKKAA